MSRKTVLRGWIIVLLLGWVSLMEGFDFSQLDTNHRLRRQYDSLSTAHKATLNQKLINAPLTDATYIEIDTVNGQPYYIEPPNETDPPFTYTAPALSSNTDPVGIPVLHSLPGAPNVIYLDFDGEVVSGTAWTPGTLNCKAFSLDSDLTTFSPEELFAIRDVWERVSEDYSPWNVDVTTERPATYTSRTLHAVITYGDASMPSGANYAGVAYIGIFNGGSTQYYSPAFVYYNKLGQGNAKYMAEAASHEIGHNFGLNHDGNSTAGYFRGLGTGPTSWAPLMGVGYNKTLSQFSKGEYPDANNHQDDMAIIGRQLGFVNKSVPLAEQANAMCSVYMVGKGVVKTQTSVDSWSITLERKAALVSIQATPYFSIYRPSNVLYNGNNLDIQLQFGSTIDAPLGVSTASINADNIAAGTYTIMVSGSEEHSSATNFSKYASVGQYTLEICIIHADIPCSAGDCCDLGTGFLKPKGTLCATGIGDCGADSYCSGVSPDCPAPSYKPSTTLCRASTVPCDAAEYCTGSSNDCPADGVEPTTTVCRPASSSCDVAENCDGTTTTCPADGYKPAGVTCRSSTDLCDAEEQCPGDSPTCPSDALHDSTHVCRPPSDLCDAPEKCTGTSKTCPPDAKQPSTYVCRTSTELCDVPEKCTGTSTKCPKDAFKSSTTVCRAAVSVCDVAEKCTGTSASCPDDRFAPATTACRASAGPCDVPEKCTGSSSTCPSDDFAPVTTLCRASAGPCDPPETCPGNSAACPPNSFAPSTQTCRPLAGDCDIEEKCTGAAAACPSDAKKSSTVVCRPSAGPCDVAEKCAGAAACPLDKFAAATVVCRAAVAGGCDVAEKCTGGGPLCPADGVVAAGKVCRASAGVCDVAETCDGASNACPANAFTAAGTICRASVGPCDPAEACTGSSAACPAKALSPSGVVCRGAGGDCDVEEKCSGSSAACPADAKRPSGFVCRAAVGVCDVAEKCSGSSVDCPVDGFKTGSCTVGGVTGTCVDGACT